MTAPQNLERDLKKAVRGEVRFDDGSRALYATDASNYRQIPTGIVLPRDTKDVMNALEVCRNHDAAVLPRGAGTSLAGQCCNVAVIFDFSRHMNRILEIDPQRKLARVQPGVILDDLQKELRPHGLMFGPDPATHNRCTFGGMIGNNACGVHSVIAGKTVDNLEVLKVLTYGGQYFETGKNFSSNAEIARQLEALQKKYAEQIRKRFPKIPRRVSGYNLDELLPENGFHVARSLVGTEGTCALFLEATVQLMEAPHSRTLVVLGYPDVFEAADDVNRILDFKPIGLEGLDEFFVRNMKKRGLHLAEIAQLPEGQSWLLVEFDAEEKAMKLAASQAAKIFKTPREQKAIWAVRESSFGASVFVPGERDTFAGFEDSAVPPAQLGKYLRDLRKLCAKYDYDVITYGHFGDGCLHTRISFDFHSQAGIQKYRAFQSDAADLVLSYGGSLSGEHGDGQTWGEFLPRMFGEEITQAFREFKKIWDPRNRMNPGKIVDAFRSDENLRLGQYATIDQEKDFARTTERCIGIGKCLKKEEGTMCPSYQVTGEEMHSTRGRAHLLHEMMRGEVIKGGWQDEHVKESLDLCLACKACKTECPVSVDVASYKAKFFSHYYNRKARPLKAYAFGYLSRWADLAAVFPQFANFFAPFLKKILGLASQRTLPKFASKSFRKTFESNKTGSEVLLWPDTFNNAFTPEILTAAVEVLEACGYRVTIPKTRLCCGRTFYDFGMLDAAKKSLQQILDQLAPQIDHGVPLVALEPSCLAVFRDELLELFPENERAKKLAQQSFSLAEFLNRDSSLVTRDSQTSDERRGTSHKVMLHGHCHQKALIGMKHEESLLARIGASCEIPDAGCCGMAGSFGYEHYSVSVAAAGRVLIPAVQKQNGKTLIVADGFSCREQVRHLTGKRPLHLAEALKTILLKPKGDL